MNGGYAQSSVPFVAMIVIDGVFFFANWASLSSSFCCSSSSMRCAISWSSPAMSGVAPMVLLLSLPAFRRRENGRCVDCATRVPVRGRPRRLALLDVERVFLVGRLGRQQRIARLLGERLHVGDRAGI